MTENPEKKPRRKLTLADHVETLDARIKATEETLADLREKRSALIEEARAKAEAALREAQAAGGRP